jgi:hypothetical protein
MVNKLILMGFAVAAVGLVALPQTLALFAGQHNFYDTITNNVYKGSGDGKTAINCGKCHADIFAELNQNGSVNQMHMNEGCDGCHMSTAPRLEGLTNGPPNATNGQFHAAAAPACLDCHGNYGGIYTGLAANATNILYGPAEVHIPFASQANTSGNPLLKGSNEACVACHTHVAVNIGWTKAYMMNFTAQEYTAADGNHSWTVSNFTTRGFVNLTTYGNRSGDINSSTITDVNMPLPTPLGFNSSNP